MARMSKPLQVIGDGDVAWRADYSHTPQFDSEILHRDGLGPLPELSRMSLETPLAVLIDPAGNSHLHWLATGRDEVRAVLGDPKRFSSHPPADDDKESIELIQAGNLLQYDPPEHTRLRQLLAPEFTVRKMRGLAPVVENIVTERLDAVQAAGPPADLVKQFALPISAQVACVFIGVPRDDRAMLGRRLDIMSDDRRGREQKVAAEKALAAYMIRLVSQKRRDTGQDLLSSLIRRSDSGVSDEELAGVGESLMIAWTNLDRMLGLGILALLDRPDQLALLRARPELIDQAVEELLRYISIVPGVSPRTAMEDVPLADKVIKVGEVVTCSVLAANRAHTSGGLGDDLDITREVTSHLAFGHGIHYCLAAPLAREVLRISYLMLLGRFPDLRLAVSRDELQFRSSAPNYQVETLPVVW